MDPELVRWADLKFSTWNLLKDKQYLAIDLVAGPSTASPAVRIVDLSNEGEAHALLSWLWQQQSSSALKFADRTLRLCDSDGTKCSPLASSDLADLEVSALDWNTVDHCQEPVLNARRPVG